MSETTGDPAMTTTKERPILFSGPLVREILAGQKTVTRRPVMPQPPAGYDRWEFPVFSGPIDRPSPAARWENDGPPGKLGMFTVRCPYGAPGDRLWVRETWFELCDPDTVKTYDPPRYGYRATWEGEEPVRVDGDGFTDWRKDGTARSPWRPGIHMPRRASRLLLEVTEVRVERLQQITEEDARREGVDSVAAFVAKWDEIYGAGEWVRNPWVWVVSFKRITTEER